MRPSPDKQFIQQAFAEIKELSSELSDVLASADISGTSESEVAEAHKRLLQAEKLKSALEEKKAAVYEKVSPFERLIGLREQYERTKNLYETAGILIPLANGEKGIRTIDGTEVPFPSLREVSMRLKAKNVREQGEAKPFIERKIDQGFTDLQITPFGMPIAVFDQNGNLDMSESAYGLANIYARLLVKTFDEGRLCYDDGTPITDNKQFDRSNPLYISDDFKGAHNKSADVDGTLLYDLTKFDTDGVEGATKSEILTRNRNNACRVGLVESEGRIVRKKDARTIGGRTLLDTSGTGMLEYIASGQSTPCPTELFAAFQGANPDNTIYKGERGQTLEDALTKAIEKLITEGKVCFDYQGNSSINYCMGAVFKTGRVPRFYWYRGDRHAVVFWSDPGARYGNCGVRPVAGE